MAINSDDNTEEILDTGAGASSSEAGGEGDNTHASDQVPAYVADIIGRLDKFQERVSDLGKQLSRLKQDRPGGADATGPKPAQAAKPAVASAGISMEEIQAMIRGESLIQSLDPSQQAMISGLRESGATPEVVYGFAKHLAQSSAATQAEKPKAKPPAHGGTVRPNSVLPKPANLKELTALSRKDLGAVEKLIADPSFDPADLFKVGF